MPMPLQLLTPNELRIKLVRQPITFAAPPTGNADLALEPASQETQLKQTPVPAGVDFKLHNGTRCRPLETWLQAPTTANVLCQHTGLSVVVTRGDSAIQPFALSSAPTATLKWSDGGGSHTAQFSDVTLDPGQGRLSLHLAFGSDAAGRKLYDAVYCAMTTPSSNIVATVDYKFGYSIMQAPPVVPFHPTPVPIHPMPVPIHPTPIPFHPPPLPVHPTPVPVHPLPVGVHPIPFTVAPPPPRGLATPVLGHGTLPPVNTTTPPPAPVATSQTLEKTFDIPLWRAPGSQPDPYPDVVKPGATGWDSFTPPKGGDTLFYKPSSDALTYYYIPGQYTLGFCAEDDGSVRPPIAADSYVTGDDYRIRVTLVALPVIDAAQREALRKHICQDVLHNLVPYVGLALAPGLDPHFVDGSFGSLETGGGTSTNLPASVQVKSVDLATESRLVFQLDMEAMDYAIVCDLLRRGIRGRLTLDDTKFSHTVDIVLRLDRLTARALDLKGSDRHVQVTNLLPYPMKIEPVTAFFVALGESGGMVFAAESHELFSDGHLLGAKDQPDAAIQADVPVASSEAYSTLLLVPGAMYPQAGTPDDWLNRVSRDPSLTPRGYALAVSPVVTNSVTAAVSALNVTLYRDGDPKPRFDQPVPLATPTTINVLASLADLMGVDGRPPTFSIEYYSHYKDGTTGLPQRTQVDPTQKTLTILPLAETADCQYVFEYNEDTGAKRTDPLDRDTALAMVDQLRGYGMPWTISIVRPSTATTDPPDDHTTQDGHTTPVDGGNGGDPIKPKTPGLPAYTGAPVTIVTSLLAFAPDGLQQVFVVLATADPGAATNTFVLDATNHAQQSWKPAVGTLPPFTYKVTYRYAGGGTKVVSGSESDMVLLLDPPAPPAPPSPPSP